MATEGEVGDISSEVENPVDEKDQKENIKRQEENPMKGQNEKLIDGHGQEQKNMEEQEQKNQQLENEDIEDIENQQDKNLPDPGDLEPNDPLTPEKPSTPLSDKVGLHIFASSPKKKKSHAKKQSGLKKWRDKFKRAKDRALSGIKSIGRKILNIGKRVWNFLFRRNVKDKAKPAEEKKDNKDTRKKNRDNNSNMPANTNGHTTTTTTTTTPNRSSDPSVRKEEEEGGEEDTEEASRRPNSFSSSRLKKQTATTRFCSAKKLQALPCVSDITSSEDYINWLSYFNVRKPWSRREKSLNPWIMIEGTKKSPLPFHERKYFTCWSNLKGCYSLPESGFQYD